MKKLLRRGKKASLYALKLFLLSYLSLSFFVQQFYFVSLKNVYAIDTSSEKAEVAPTPTLSPNQVPEELFIVTPTLFPSPTQSLQQNKIQEASESASVSEATPSAELDQPTVSPTSTPSSVLTPTPIHERPVSPGKIRMREANKSRVDFRSNEKPKFEFDARDPKFNKFWRQGNLDRIKSLKTKIVNTNHGDVLLNAEISYDDTNKSLVVQPVKSRNFTPGLYHLNLQVPSDAGTIDISQDFTWGVLALNTDKSSYSTNEEVKLSMAVLDDFGRTKCLTGETDFEKGKLWLTIVSPSGETQELSTENGKIFDSGKCGVHSVTNEADFQAKYVTKEEGIYQMHLVGENYNGKRSIDDVFKVEKSPNFVIERTSQPTRIYPPANYSNEINLISNNAYEGDVIEIIPASFDVFNTTAEISTDSINNLKLLKWHLVFGAGETKQIKYDFNAPDVSPEFYLLGGIKFVQNQMTVFEENRNWQIAGDATVTSTASGGNWTAGGSWNGGNIPVAADDVVIATTGTNRILMNSAPTVASITINSGSTLLAGTNPLRISGNYTNNGTHSGTNNANSTITILGNSAVIDGSGSTTNGIRTWTMSGTTPSFKSTANISIGSTINVGTSVTVTNNGIVTITSNGLIAGGGASSAWLQASNSTLNYAGRTTAMSTGNLNAVASGNIVNLNYNGAQTCKVTQYYHLQLTNGGAKTCNITANVLGDVTVSKTAASVNWTLASAFTINGNLAITSGTVLTAGNALTVTGTTTLTTATLILTNNTGAKTFTDLVTVGAGSTLSGASTNIIAGSGFVNSGTVTITGVVTMNLAGAVLTANKDMSITSLTVNTGAGVTISAGTVTLGAASIISTGAVTNNSTTTISGTFNGTGTWTQGDNSTLNLGGATTNAAAISTLTANATGNVVNYNRNGAQTCNVTQYYHLTLSAGGAKTCNITANVLGNVTVGTNASSWTLGSAFTINGDLSITSGTVTTAGSALTVTGHTNVTTGTLIVTNNTGSKTFTDQITVGAGSTFSGDSTSIVAGSGIVNSGTVNITGILTMSSAGAVLTANKDMSITSLTVNTGAGVTISAGTVTLGTATIISTGAVTNNSTTTISGTFNGTGTWTQGDNSTLNLGGATTNAAAISTLTANATGNVVNYTGSASQTVKATNYYNLASTSGGTSLAFVQEVPNAAAPKMITSGTGLTSDAFVSGQNNLIVGVAYAWHVTSLPDTVTWSDNKGNSWVAYKSGTYPNYTGGTEDMGVYIGYGIASVGYGSGHTVNVRGFSASTEISLGILEFSGVDTVSPANGNNSALGSGTSLVSGTLASALGNNVFVGGMGYAAPSSTDTVSNTWSGSTMAHSNGDWTYAGGADSYYITSGTQQGSWTSASGSQKYVGVIAAFKEGASAATRILPSSGTVGVAGTFTPGAPTYTITGSTVDYNGTNQTVADIQYNNLTLSTSGTKTLQVGTTSVTGNLSLTGTASATTVADLTIGGNLDVGTGSAFTVADHAITVTGTTSVTGTLDHSSVTGTKTYTGAVTVNSGGVWTNTGNSGITFNGGLTHNGTTFTSGTGPYTFATNSQAIGCTTSLSITNVVVTGVTLTNNCASFTVGTALSGTGGLTNAASKTLFLSGTASISTLTVTASGNTVNYNGTAAGQTIFSTTYANLTVDKTTRTALLGGTIVTSGNMTITSGTVDTDNTNHYNMTIAGNWTNNGTFLARTGRVTFNGAAQTLSGSSTSTFYQLYITGTTTRTVTVNNGTHIAVAANGTLNLAGASSNLLTLTSDNTSDWFLEVSSTSTTVSVVYTKPYYSNANGYKQIDASTGGNVDGGGNHNWLFGSANLAPNLPTALLQFKVDDTLIATGTWVSATSIKFTASATDQDASDTIYLCVEKKDINSAFTNSEDLCGSGVSYVGVGVTVSVTITGITDATEYHWHARVKDTGGLYSSWVSYGGNGDGSPSDRDFALDTTAPSGGAVKDGITSGADVSFNDGSLSAISGNWTGVNSDVSGLKFYEYSIGTTAGGTTVKDWTNVGIGTSVAVTGLTLQTSQNYYFNLRATDNAGNLSDVISSNGQTVAPTLSFALGSTSITFANLNPAHSSDTQTTTLTTSTNAYNGYVVRAYKTDVLKSTAHPLIWIDDFNAGSYSTPAGWTAGTYGFGYSTSDTLIQGSAKFPGSGACPGGGTAPCFAPFTSSQPGEIVADHPTGVVGSSISNEVFNITYKVAVPDTQQAGPYSTAVVYTIAPQY